MTKTSSDNPRVRTKHMPQRTCLACRQVKPKRELVRLVRVADGGIEIDPGGKKAGRGAYLCGRPECWEIGLKGGRLEHALKTKLTGPDRQQLGEYVKGMLQGVS
ncbi:MAG TPA: YlxR family protein [Dehalococcoidia bacterium]|nr:YlxR family protein [Dehalococcoidia bacterium]